MSYHQLEIFPFPVDPLFEIRKELTRMDESAHKVRRGTYAQINKIGKMFCDQEKRISELEHKLFVLEKFIKEKL